MNVLKILFICLLLVFPFGELLRFDFGNNIRSKPLDVIAGIITLYWCILFCAKKIKINSISWKYLIFPAIGVISLLINSSWLQPTELLASSLYLVRWISYAGVFLAVNQLDSVFRNKIIIMLLIDGFVLLILGYFQYFFFSDLKPLYYLGWDDHMYRLFSTFLDPNYTGAFFVLYFLFCLGLLYKYWQNKKPMVVEKLLFNKILISKKIILIGLTLASVLSLLALLLTFSRSSLLMLIVGASVFFVLIGRKKLILLLFAVILIFTLLISSKFYVENINLFRQASSTARINNYKDAISIINEHPLLGVGFNTYRYAKEHYNIKTGWVKAPSHADAGVDNSFLFILVTTGIVGLVAYLMLWWLLFKRAFYYYKKQKNIFAFIFIASGAGLFTHALFINSLFFPAIMIWMWILFGLMESKSH